MANPTLITTPIAENGAKNAIPNTVDPSTGALSQEKGFDEINSIPLTDGGKAPDRLDFNGVFNLLSKILFYCQKGWQFEWDSSQSYYAGCIVKDTSNGKMYRCLNDVTSTTAPHSDTTNWKLWDLSMLGDYLPLAGGTFNAGNIYLKKADNNNLEVIAGTDRDKASKLALASTIAMLDASNADGTQKSRLLLKSNGDLIIVPDDTVTPAQQNDLGGSAIVAKSFGVDALYVKYASGFLIQEMTIQVPVDADITSYTVALPISFSNNNFSATVTLNNETAVQMVSISRESASQIKLVSDTSLRARYYHVIAVGY